MTIVRHHVSLEQFGGPENFKVIQTPMPDPGPGELVVKTLAASVQFTDVILRKGQYPDLKEKPPLTLGYDVVGDVVAVGPGVTGVSVGDRVSDMTMVGGYADHQLLKADRVTKVPKELDPAQAVSLVLGAMTAYQLLHRHAHVKPGQRILVHGAAGGVGQALLELARASGGLDVYGTARGEHRALVEGLGAKLIDYKKEDFTRAVPGGFDVVFDGIAEDRFKKSWSVVKKGGFLSAYGFSNAVQRNSSFLQVGMLFANIFAWHLLPNGKDAGFYSITSMRKQHPEWFKEDQSALFEMLRQSKLNPRIAERISLSGVADAHRRLESGGLDGKLVIVPAG